MQVQLPLLSGQKALDHVGIKHQHPRRDSVLGDSAVKVCHGGSASRELHMRDGQDRGGAPAEVGGQMDDSLSCHLCLHHRACVSVTGPSCGGFGLHSSKQGSSPTKGS